MALLKFRSPLRKLVAFFQASRDQWKEKCQRAKYKLKLLKRRFENLQLSRDQWQQDYQQAEAQREQLQARGEHLQAQHQQLQVQVEALLKKGALVSSALPVPEADHETPPTGPPLVECLAPEDWDTPVANHHYSLGQIAGALSLMLDCRGSLRGAALATGLINRLLGGEQEVPSPTSVRSWLLRIGLHQLQRPLEKAGDWVWIVDHTVQIGELKCLIIVGFRLGVWQQQEDRTLAYEDVELIGLWPVRTSTGEIVDEQLESAIARTGLPWLIISDDGRDLHRGLALFQGRHGEVVWIYDIKHKTASLLKRELEDDPVWTAFATRANQMKRQVHQTELAFCNSPQQRGKARI